jgi:hypothetical protein
VPSAPEDVVYGIGRIDASGRIADRAVTSAQGWAAGDRLTLTADAGVVTARRDPGGMITVFVAPTMRRRRPPAAHPFAAALLAFSVGCGSGDQGRGVRCG